MVLITTIALFNLLPGVNKNFLLLIKECMLLIKKEIYLEDLLIVRLIHIIIKKMGNGKEKE